MPPMRTMSLDKPVKTERTHEENQERAYIAASRRSDRSLEARVESARRASEIHKRRTGRSLRVTEQDVVNEEMYEEEDDDLPLQYRRLTAHLQTNSTDFNRRLAAYITSQVAMRTALDQAMRSSYGPHANGGSYTFNHQQPLQPFLGPGSPTSPTSPVSYRQAPYPIPESQSYRSSQHQPPSSTTGSHHHSASFSSPAQNQSPMANQRSDLGRRLSDPTPEISTLLSSPRSSNHAAASVEQTNLQSNNESAVASGDNFNHDMPLGHSNFSPLTTALPPESQMFLTPGLLSQDKSQQNLYNYNPSSSFGKWANFHPSYDGMSQTLAPGALDASLDAPFSSFTDGVLKPYSAAYSFNLGPDDSDVKDDLFSNSPAHATSGQNTPTDREWASYINSSWD